MYLYDVTSRDNMNYSENYLKEKPRMQQLSQFYHDFYARCI